MSGDPDNFIRRIWRRVRGSFAMPATETQVADVNRRLARIERQLVALETMWLRTRHLEPAVQSQGLVATLCGHSDWPSLLAALDEARQRIAARWAAIKETQG